MGVDLGWVHEAALFDEGRKVAFYETHGYAEDRIGEPPQVQVGDLVEDSLGEPIAVTGVVHGHAPLRPEEVRNPDWPYGEVEPGIVFDEFGGRLFAVHADGAGVTAVDLISDTVGVKRFEEAPSFWGRVMSWLIPPAQAKGSEPSARISAWLNEDRSLLYATGEATDAWRDSERALHTTHTPLGLIAIKTDTLDIAASVDLPVTQGMSSRGLIALSGSKGTRIWCDEVCKPGNNEPEVEGEYEASGLIILDATTFEMRLHHRPGVGFKPIGVLNNWLLMETFDDGWAFETIDIQTGRPGGRTQISNNSYFVITDHGLYLAEQLP